MNTRLGVLIDGLVDTLTTALPNVLVIDGPPLEGASTGKEVLCIGWDGSPDGDEAGTAAQEIKGLGAPARDETINLTCYAESSSGSKAMKSTRDAALAVVQAVEDALRDDMQLGGTLTGPSRVWFGGIDALRQPQLSSGRRAGVVFTISAFARI